MNLRKGKAALFSRGIMGGFGSLIGIITLFSEFRDILAENPELVDETRLAIIALVSAVSAVIGIIGRWKAKVPVKAFLWMGNK